MKQLTFKDLDLSSLSTIESQQTNGGFLLWPGIPIGYTVKIYEAIEGFIDGLKAAYYCGSKADQPLK